MLLDDALTLLQEFLVAIDTESERQRVLLAFQNEGQRQIDEQMAILTYARVMAAKAQRKAKGK